MVKHWSIGLIVGAAMVMAACGRENPSATSSDDTHSIGQPANTEENIASAKAASSSPSIPTTNVNVESPSLKTSTTSPQIKVGQNVSTSVAKNSVTTIQISTTLPVVPVDNGSTPGSSAAPSKTRPTPTIAPTCDAMPLADCQNVDLRGLDLYFANFQGANLAGANMSGMDLTGIDFTDANLTGANLTGATLDYALFFNTTLTNAELRGVSMESIVWDETTIWPAGFVPPDY